MVSRGRKIEIAYEQETSVAPKRPKPDAALSGGPAEALEAFAVLPEPRDNCAILRKRIDVGMRVRMFDDSVITVETTVLEGHRLAVSPIPEGGQLLSWGLPFGVAIAPVKIGEYVCNERVLSALRLRQIEGLPAAPNFDDLILPYDLNEEHFQPAEQVALLPQEQRLTFLGFDRSSAQGGVGTRNFIAIVPTSALSGPYARKLVAFMRQETRALRNCDGLVALHHTEAALDPDAQRPHNWDLLLRTLSGFVSHPNVAAALVVGYGNELLSPQVLQSHMKSIGTQLPKWFQFLTLQGDLEPDLQVGKQVLSPWLPEVDKLERTEQPLSELRVALQCGGSDAFSGVSGNPAVGTAAKLLIENGGAAVLAETDELIGAESYILARTRSFETAKKFLHFVERFKERFSWHGGQSAESNPSGGNKLRGLYNIVLKSLGAAKKKHASVSLDGILDYGERLLDGQRGYYFMDSPGNDLESIAGQVASGCNAIFFVTGNGSITNFPFAPTIKVITTTDRYKLLQSDMDFNAGQYQDGGVPMAELGAQLFKDLLRVASGHRSLGERAGHSTVCIWREWALSGPVADMGTLELGECTGAPLATAAAITAGAGGTTEDDDGGIAMASIVQKTSFEGFSCTVRANSQILASPGTERIGLVLPTSLCSGEVARGVADELNVALEEFRSGGGNMSDGQGLGAALASKIDRFIALPHSEGCGCGHAGDGEQLYSRVMIGHLTHANIALALCLEHGCEKTHNDWYLEEMRNRNIDTSCFGFASIQLDGGNEAVRAKVLAWFQAQASVVSPRTPSTIALPQLPIAVLGEASCGRAAELSASLVRAFVGAGGTVVVPSCSLMLRSAAFLDELCSGREAVEPSLAFAQPLTKAGAHVMHVPAGVFSRVEMVTGLVSVGVGVVIIVRAGGSKVPPVIGHPLVQILNIIADAEENTCGAADAAADLVLCLRQGEDEHARQIRWLGAAASLIASAASRKLQSCASRAVDFQIARGPTGVSA